MTYQGSGGGAPGVTVAGGAPGVTVVTTERLTQQQALQSIRDALSAQLQPLKTERLLLQEEMERAPRDARADLRIRSRALDDRIGALERQIASADRQLAGIQGEIPGISETRPADTRGSGRRDGPGEEWVAIPALLVLFVAFPITLAFARRIWKRSGEPASGLTTEIMDRLNRMDQNIDAIALEVERIGESQRYLTKQNAEHLGLGAGAAERVEAARVGERERSR